MKPLSDLSIGHKQKLRNQIITGARNYQHYLVNKVFKIVCEDGVSVDVRFFINDFKHLTGLYSDLDDASFYENCCSGHISTGNIDTSQKYNWSTLKIKGKYVEKIHELLYKDGKKILVSEALDTKTCVFPYVVKNMSNNICVGFVDTIHKTRSLRKAASSTKCKYEKTIIAIFAKPKDDKEYSELVYLTDVCNMYERNEALLEELSEDIQMKFLEILTKPDVKENSK